MSDTNRVEELPSWAQDLISKLRNEAADARIKNRDAVEAAVKAEGERLAREHADKLTSLEAKLTAAENVASGEQKLLNQLKGAIKAGVPASNLLSVAPRLVGNSEDEYAEDAKSVAQGFGVTFDDKQRQRPIDPSQGRGADKTGDPSEGDVFADFLGLSLGWKDN